MRICRINKLDGGGFILLHSGIKTKKYAMHKAVENMSRTKRQIDNIDKIQKTVIQNVEFKVFLRYSIKKGGQKSCQLSVHKILPCASTFEID